MSLKGDLIFSKNSDIIYKVNSDIIYKVKEFLYRGSQMNLQESGQMYLESILILTKKNPNVRSIDVCEYMGFSKPSVSRAIGLLKSGGYVTVDENGFLSLTAEGLAVAHKMYERHTLLTELLTSMGVSEKTASEDACKIEHHISDESFNAIKKALNK